MRSGARLYIVAALLGFAALAAFLASAFMSMASWIPRITSGWLRTGNAAIPAAMVIGVSLLLASIAVHILGLLRFRSGYRDLKGMDRAFGVCYTGTNLLLIGLAVVASGLLIMLAALTSASAGLAAIGAVLGALAVLLVGGIMGLVGHVLAYIVGAFKLDNRYGDSRYMVAGVLFIIDLILIFFLLFGILTFVGFILLYAALGDTLKGLGRP